MRGIVYNTEVGALKLHDFSSNDANAKPAATYTPHACGNNPISATLQYYDRIIPTIRRPSPHMTSYDSHCKYMHKC